MPTPLRRLTTCHHRGGAGASGLARLVETHTLQAAGDACVAVALAGTLFFAVPTHEAKSRVAVYLLTTMAPFALLAPVLGPLLDRFRHGRRTALASSMLLRAVLALVIGRSMGHSMPFALYPAALGVLVAGKAYSIARAAAVPRLTPPGMSLVRANARLTFAGAITPGVAGAMAVGVTRLFGHEAELAMGAAAYCLSACLATRLPAAADGGEDVEPERPLHGGLLRGGLLQPDVEDALRSAVALRWLAGFLLLYGAFVVRQHPMAGLSTNLCLAALAVGIGAGNVLGTAIGPRTASLCATRLAALLLAVATATCALNTVAVGLVTVVALAIVSATAAAVAKLALDATIQQRVPDTVRTSTFARSETTMQVAWVVGGGLGILLPTRPEIGFAVATGVLVVAFAMALGARPFQRPSLAPAVSPIRQPTG